MISGVSEVLRKVEEPNMASRRRITIDANEAAASVAYRASEAIAIYPITPSSTMAEFCDEWSSRRVPNLWGLVPEVAQMQSEAGAAGAVHGALQAGALSTTFTASQGLLLMIPNMYKIAGELTPFTMHVAARTLATHALSIFGDHSDVMACRQTGFALLCANSVQEAHDMAAVAHAATLETRIPFLHFFDGFRTSHEVAKIEELNDDDLRALISEPLVHAHRRRGLTPDRPVLRGTAQNPDVFFQAREAANSFYDACPGVVERTMKKLAELTGRRYGLFEYVGHPEAERVIVVMGSGADTAHETVDYMVGRGDKVGVLKVRLYRPFVSTAFLSALPKTVRNLAVLDRTKEPGATGDPLYLDVIAALAEAHAEGRSPFAVPPRVIAGRYGLSSKEFTPAMVKSVFDETGKANPKRHFTVGIVDDVTHTSLTWDPSFRTESADVSASVFYGLGADGTVGANKNSIKIVGQETDLSVQGYFVYDSKKSGAITISHLRTSKRPIRSAYLVDRAGFVACHQFEFVDKIDVLEYAAPGSSFLLNAPFPTDQVWDHLPREVQEQIIEKKIRFFAIDAYELAKREGMGTRINTIMQTCFFAIAGVLPPDEAIKHIKKAIEKTYGKRGPEVVRRNCLVVDQALENLHEIPVPAAVNARHSRPPLVSERAPDFVQKVTAVMLAGKGDLLPVSAFPVDGTFPVATAKWEKRNIALEIPVWDSKICIQCNQCALVCPHAAIRAKVYEPSALGGAPSTFKSTAYKGNEHKGKQFTIQVAPEDCTGCNLCVVVCPAKDRTNPKHKAIDMHLQAPLREPERTNYDFFLNIPELDRTEVVKIDHKSSQFFEPLFEYSGACAGCGETPYLKMLTQLFGDRLLIANATGCSSIYGGNLPTTPYTTNRDGRGPAWANSLFEDNAEFGFGFRLALDAHIASVRGLIQRLAPQIGEGLVTALLDADQAGEAGIAAQRERVDALRRQLSGMKGSANGHRRRNYPARIARRLPREEERVARRRRRVGVRHRIRRPRPRAGQPARRQHPGDGHRGLLEHRGPGVEGDPARRVGEIRDVGQGGWKEGSRPARQHVRPCVCRPRRLRREDDADGPGVSRSGVLSRTVAHHRLQPLHCARLRHGQRRGAAETGRRLGRLAAVSLRSAADSQGRAAALHLDYGPPKAKVADYLRNESRFRMVERADPARYKAFVAESTAAAQRRYSVYSQLAGIKVPAFEAAATPEASGNATVESAGFQGEVMDLSTTYLGMRLPHPLIVGAGTARRRSGHGQSARGCRRAMLVLRSLYEEEITGEQMSGFIHEESISESFAEATTYAPESLLALGPDEYLEHVRLVKQAVKIPVVASLNGVTRGGWTGFAKQIEEAGADALELHIYHAASDMSLSAADVERDAIEIVRDVKASLRIPVAIKLAPLLTAFANFARSLDTAGADGLVLFTRFHRVDIDVVELEVVRSLPLSDSSELPLRLRGTAALAGRIKASLAITGGIHTGLDVIKATMAGAHAAQMVSSLLRHGPNHLRTVRARGRIVDGQSTNGTRSTRCAAT